MINSDVKQQLPPGIMQRFESAGVVREVTAARKPATQPIGAGLGGQSEAERAEVEKKVQQEAHSVLQTMQDSAVATQEPGWSGLGLRKRVATTIADIAEDSAGVYDAAFSGGAAPIILQPEVTNVPRALEVSRQSFGTAEPATESDTASGNLCSIMVGYA